MKKTLYVRKDINDKDVENARLLIEKYGYIFEGASLETIALFLIPVVSTMNVNDFTNFVGNLSKGLH